MARSIDRDDDRLLRSASVGPLGWNPPVELGDEFAGSRRGGKDGFYITAFGIGSNTSHVPQLEATSLSFEAARRVAQWLDEELIVRRSTSGPKTAVEWVDAIVAALARHLEAAVDRAQSRYVELTRLQATAQTDAALRAAERERRPSLDDVEF